MKCCSYRGIVWNVPAVDRRFRPDSTFRWWYPWHVWWRAGSSSGDLVSRCRCPPDPPKSPVWHHALSCNSDPATVECTPPGAVTAAIPRWNPIKIETNRIKSNWDFTILSRIMVRADISWSLLSNIAVKTKALTVNKYLKLMKQLPQTVR